MKKIVLMLFFMCIIIVPFQVRALIIGNLSTKGNGVVKSGEQVTITLQAPTSVYSENEGIWLIYFNLAYDKSYLALTEITSPGFNTIVQYHGDGAYLISEAIENSNVSGMCVNGLLFCGTYSVTLKFQVTNVTEAITTSISTTDFRIATLVITEDREYTENDATEIISSSSATHVLSLRPNTTTAKEETPTIVPEKQQTTESTKKTTTVTKSSNNYLKSMEISDHNIDFNKDNTNYEVAIDSNVNSLDIKPVVEHGSASYKISGNENLEDGSIVKVVVSAENGSTREYDIKVKKTQTNSEETSNGQITDNKEQKPEKKFDKLTNKIVFIVGGIFGLFVLIGLICIINNIRDNRRLDKLLDDDK